MVIEIAPDMAVDIPLIWQYIGEILGAFIGAPSSNMFMLKDVLSVVPQEKSKQFFQYIIGFASGFSVRRQLKFLLVFVFFLPFSSVQNSFATTLAIVRFDFE